MSTINSVNNSLISSSGAGNFAGSTSCVFSGDVDASAATDFIIPNGTNPSTSLAGQLALDTSVSGYPGLLQYYTGVTTMQALGMNASDLSANNNYVLKYSSASSSLYMAAQSGSVAGKLAGYSISQSTSNDSTTSLTAVSTSLTASITPTNSSSYIMVQCYGYSSVSNTGGAFIDSRYATFEIRRTTGTPTTIKSNLFGRIETSTNSVSLPSYAPVCICAFELAGNTLIHTYVLRFFVPDSNLTASLRGDISISKIIIFEILP